MAGEFASVAGDVDRLDESPTEHAGSRAWDIDDAAALPSFKQLPQHRRADRGRAALAANLPVDPEPKRVPKPPPLREPVRAPQPVGMPERGRPAPPLLLDHPLPAIEPMRARRRRRWRPLRAAALLLAGSVIGAAAALATHAPEISAPRDEISAPHSENTYLTVLPPFAPAPPPPQIVYVDKWQIVVPEPLLLQRYETLAPAMPIAPPPEIVIVERAGKAPAVPGARPRLRETSAAHPETKPEQRDMATEIERWLSRSR
jgi:hypothetical protein